MTRSSVLLVEDDPDVAMIAGEALRAAGLDVRVANTVERAIQECVEAEPDLALVDIRLPGRSGWEFVREVRESARWPAMRVAIYSVHDDEPSERLEAKRLGVDCFLSKSGDPVELVASVQRLLA